MIGLIKKNGNQNTTSEVRRLLVFVNLIATNYLIPATFTRLSNKLTNNALLIITNYDDL
jgi:hypothetical protein